jgi:hypothetical protein
LEVAAGELDAAREFLARALAVSESTHGRIARAIQELASKSPGAEAFPLLHWLRLGVALVYANEPDAEEFSQALEETGVFQSPWATGEMEDYPAHGILRRVAVLHAVKNRSGAAENKLSIMRRKLAPMARGQIVLGLVQVSAVAEVAAALWLNDPAAAKRVLFPTRAKGVTITRMISQIRDACGGRFSPVSKMLDSWSDTIEQLTPDGTPPPEATDKLRRLTQAVDF